MVGQAVGELLRAQQRAGRPHAHRAALEEPQRIGDDVAGEHLLDRVPPGLLRERRVAGVAAVLDGDGGAHALVDAVHLLEAPRHRRVVAGVIAGEPRLEVLARRRRDVIVARPGLDLVHPLPAERERAVAHAARDGRRRHQHRRSAGRAAGLDSHVRQQVQAQVVVHLGLAEQLVLEVIGELAVAGEVDVPLHLERIQLEVVLLEEHAEGHHAQLLELLLRVPLAVVGGTRGDEVHRARPFRDAQVAAGERDHRITSNARGAPPGRRESGSRRAAARGGRTRTPGFRPAARRWHRPRMPVRHRAGADAGGGHVRRRRGALAALL